MTLTGQGTFGELLNGGSAQQRKALPRKLVHEIGVMTGRRI
jgi:hypothetical protein